MKKAIRSSLALVCAGLVAAGSPLNAQPQPESPKRHHLPMTVRPTTAMPHPVISIAATASSALGSIARSRNHDLPKRRRQRQALLQPANV